ncbi:glycoside hydrolase family 5 protein [Apiospora marii]|uniref:glycoside hydrolase family 5 protein n=1 Tax=Apiospora marii TaxID=335849 RepID=UPI0031305504
MRSMLQATFLHLLAASGGFFSQVAESRTLPRQSGWPYAPFVTSGRDVKNTEDQDVVYAGANWPGAGEVMIPEGLQYQSIETIVSKMKSIGMNAIRLTFAIELIDQIYDNEGVDVPLSTAFTEALGAENGKTILDQVLANNPSFTESTTRLEVYDAIAAECAKQEIFVHLDNHMSRGAWCCNTEDGNSWFNDVDFNVDNWTRGLAYMAEHGKSWPALVSIALRNELRSPDSNPELKESSYNWQDWYKYIKQGTEAVHAANPDLLIFLSGLNFDTTMTPVVRGTALTPGSATFDLADFEGYADKLVLELHNYDNNANDCAALQGGLRNNGYQAMSPGEVTTANVFPVLLTEFGFNMNATEWRRTYATCLADYMVSLKSGWFIWVLAGSYYIRDGTQDYEETWGLLNHDWSDWRSLEYVEGGLIPLIEGTASP